MHIEIYNSPNLHDIKIVENLLLGEDIICEIRDEGIVSSNQLFANAVQGIKLLVLKDDQRKAKAIVDQFLTADYAEIPLDEFEESEDDEYDAEDICPKCNSVKIKKSGYAMRNTVLIVGIPVVVIVYSPITLILCAASIIISSFFKSKARCYNCQHRW
ncbi:MAG: DUF2007 domain-containing protein [Fibrobacterales bacterium]